MNAIETRFPKKAYLLNPVSTIAYCMEFDREVPVSMEGNGTVYPRCTVPESLLFLGFKVSVHESIPDGAKISILIDQRRVVSDEPLAKHLEDPSTPFPFIIGEAGTIFTAGLNPMASSFRKPFAVFVVNGTPVEVLIEGISDTEVKTTLLFGLYMMCGPNVHMEEDEESTPPMTTKEIKTELKSMFRNVWIREIEDEKPEADITREEIIRWTDKAQTKISQAIKELVDETIKKETAMESS